MHFFRSQITESVELTQLSPHVYRIGNYLYLCLYHPICTKGSIPNGPFYWINTFMPMSMESERSVGGLQGIFQNASASASLLFMLDNDDVREARLEGEFVLSYIFFM